MNKDNDMLYKEENPDEEAPLYSLPDESDDNTEPPVPGIGHGEEDMPYAFGKDDPDADDADTEDVKGTRSRNPFLMLCATMLSPVTGWKALKRSRCRPESMASGCFIPIVAAAGLSYPVQYIFTVTNTLAELMLQAVIAMMSYAFSYFVLPLLGRLFLNPRVSETLQTDFGKCVTMALLSTLALFRILLNILPGFEPVIVFLPIWTIYLVFRAMPILKAPQDKMAMNCAVLSILVIGLPIAWNALLNMVF